MEKSERDRFVEIGKMVEELSEYAKKSQKSAKSSWKEDGSIVTNVDLEISETIRREIAKLFPDDNVVTEEELTEWKPDAKWNFILDPIDGTEVFYSGLPSFCTALGILDGKLNPVGAFIAAPRFGIGEEKLILSYIPGEDIYLNGERIDDFSKDDGLEEIMISSRLSGFDYSSFHGKVRSIGSSVLQIITPALVRRIKGSVTLPCYAWDLAAAIAVANHASLVSKYPDGSTFRFTFDMVRERKKAQDVIYTAKENEVDNLMKACRKIQ